MGGRPRAMHKADIKAALEKRGLTLTQAARRYGCQPASAWAAVGRPCFTGEQAIACALGIPPQQIWPDRYDPDGTPRHPRARHQDIGAAALRQRQKREAA